MEAFVYIIYNSAIFLLSPLLVLYFFSRSWQRGRSLVGMAERLGRVRHLPPAKAGGRLWLHAVSVGEVGVAAILVPEILKRCPHLRIVISTVTDTGREEAMKIDGVEYVFYLPFDFPFSVRSALERICPTAMAIVETELWPNLVWHAARRGLPVCMVNGRLSENSFRGYLRVRPLFFSVLGKLVGVAARGEADAIRYRALGASGVFAAGNVKFDVPAAHVVDDPEHLKEKFGLGGADPIIVAGSTHPGEEEALARAICTLRERFGRLGVLVAPRHLPRLADAEEALRRGGVDPVRWSELKDKTAVGQEGGQVVLLDTMGQLGEAYECATVAFIGGSIVPHGGQNPIEAARWGVPVIFGRHMQNFSEVAGGLIEVGGAFRVERPEDLAEAFLPLLSDTSARTAAGASAWKSVMANRGAAGRVADYLVEMLKTSRNDQNA
ncbi:MAG: 3-deoxy-D-manno-octulosonic acid transferase [Nitrospinaceae bacterium]|nr:3-deoxy-D-manno-octulosonic acid transferase [Nitrospinaceae bacterium]